MPTTIPTTTSSTRPGSPSAGDAYFETDTKNYIIYDGANWRAYVSDGLTGWSGSNTYSMNFDGTDDYLIGSPVAASAQQGTISAWIKTLASGSSQTIFNSSDTSVDNTWFNFRVSSAGKVLVYALQSGGTLKDATGSTTVNDGAWHHVALVSDGSAYSFYVDGSAETVTGTNNDGTWLGDLSTLGNATIGRQVRQTASGVQFNGNIDEVAVWDSALSAAQITNIYKGESNGGSGGTNGTPGNLLSFSPKAWWRMGDGVEAGSGDIIYDMSSFSNDLTIVNQANFDNTTAP